MWVRAIYCFGFLSKKNAHPTTEGTTLLSSCIHRPTHPSHRDPPSVAIADQPQEEPCLGHQGFAQGAMEDAASCSLEGIGEDLASVCSPVCAPLQRRGARSVLGGPTTVARVARQRGLLSVACCRHGLQTCRLAPPGAASAQPHCSYCSRRSRAGARHSSRVALAEGVVVTQTLVKQWANSRAFDKFFCQHRQHWLERARGALNEEAPRTQVQKLAQRMAWQSWQASPLLFKAPYMVEAQTPCIYGRDVETGRFTTQSLPVNIDDIALEDLVATRDIFGT